jgi:Protein of unknown function (DUF732)
MKKPTFTLFAGIVVALGTAGTASASEADFVDAIASLDHYAIECPGCAQDALDVGYRVCAAFGTGGETAAIQEVLNSYNADTSPNRNYYANLFAQYSAYELCPQHNGQIGPI